MKKTCKMRLVIHNLYCKLKKIFNSISQRILLSFRYIVSCVRAHVCGDFSLKTNIILVCVIFMCFVFVQYNYILINEELLPSVKLPSAEEVINPRKPNIFFVIAENKLTVEQACAIESAAFANPSRSVNVLFNDPIPLRDTPELQVLRSYKNIKLARMEYHKLTKNTPFDTLLPIYKPDVLKILTMNMFGGIYLDLDVIVVKSFNGLSEDFVVRFGSNLFTSGVVGITTPKIRQTPLIKYLLSELLAKVNDSDYEDIGGDIIKRTLGKYCVSSYPPDMSSETCPGLEVYSTEFIVRKGDVKKYLLNAFFYRPYDKVRAVSMKTYESHPLTSLIKMYFHSMAARYCPNMFKKCKF